MHRPKALILLLLLTTPLFADRWEGSIALPTGKLAVQVDLDGANGDISIPAQGAADLPLTNIVVDGAKMSFSIRDIPGNPTFTGTRDGDRLDGQFTQGGASFPFSLTRVANHDPAAPLAGFDTFVGEALQSWNVPGLALAVVADGKVIYAKGFGHRDVEKHLPMTADTLLPIGSVTKSFTTLALGTLVEEGKLDWDEPLRTYVPEFRTEDERIGNRITPRDLVTHRSGFPRHDLVWYNNNELTRRQLVERLGHLSANQDLRARWQYNNLMFLTGGFLLEELTGKEWEDVIRERIFAPLGMTRSNFENAKSAADADHARGYRDEKGTLRVLPFREVGRMGPAGSISSSANEMARYALLHLGRGPQIVDKATLREMHTPQMVVGGLPDDPALSPATYGLGWFIDTYRGHLRVHHGGAIDGFNALLTLFPNDGVAVVALANVEGTQLPNVATNHIADRLLKLEAKDWNGEALARRALARQLGDDAEKKKNVTRKSGTRPSHAIADYAGDYEHAGYGVLRIERIAGDKLQATYNRIPTPLEHWHYDVWSGGRNEADPTFEDMKYHFRTDVSGNVFAVEAQFEQLSEPILFRKRPDARLTDPAHLTGFTGDYHLGPQPLTISLRGTKLVLNIAGQPPYTLAPDIDGWFNLEALPGYRVRFTGEALELSQPNGLFTATRKK